MVTAIAIDYREEFEVNEDDIILTPGKFDSEHISVPYFWDCVQNGDCETVTLGNQAMVYNSTVYFVVIGDSEREEFPILKDRYGLAMYETENGFVNTVWFYSRHDYNEAMDNPTEVL